MPGSAEARLPALAGSSYVRFSPVAAAPYSMPAMSPWHRLAVSNRPGGAEVP
jgi:hypothetical protein